MSYQGSVGNYCVDIVMCIDATGSMSPILNEVKANALSFYELFEEAMEDQQKTVDRLRLKVIAFRDYIIDSEPMKESRFFNLPEEAADFRRFVDSIEASGGGDTPECALEAIARAMRSDWTTDGEKQRHVILVFTDAPAVPLGVRADCPGYPADMPKDLPTLGAWWEGTDQEFSGNYRVSAGRLVAFVPNAEPWTAMETWNRYWPAYSEAGRGLSEVDMAAAIDLLVGSMGKAV